MTPIRSPFARSRSEFGQIQRQFRACLVGGAIGDAMGMPFENVAERTIRASCSFPIQGFLDPLNGAPCQKYGLKRGMYTDDTQAVRATAIKIAAKRSATPRVVAEALYGWLFENAIAQDPRYPGQTTLKAIQNYAKTKNPHTCGVQSSTCGAAIRISPVALWFSAKKTVRWASGITGAARVTHTGPGAIDGAMVVAHLIATGVKGIIPDVGDLLRLCKSPRMLKALGMVITGLNSDEPCSELFQEIGGGTGAHEVVPMAVYHLYKSKFAFELCLASALGAFHPDGTDMDSILSITGAVSGLHCVGEVEASLLRADLETIELIEKEASDLASAAQH